MRIIIDHRIEYWDFYSDGYLLDAWEAMTLGGVRVIDNRRDYYLLSLGGPCVLLEKRRVRT